MTHICHASFIHDTNHSCAFTLSRCADSCETWLAHMSYVIWRIHTWHHSYVSCLIHTRHNSCMCICTQSLRWQLWGVWNDSFHMRHDSFIYATWLIDMHLHSIVALTAERDDSYRWISYERIHVTDWWVKSHQKQWGMSRMVQSSHVIAVRHAWFMYVTWLVHGSRLLCQIPLQN